MTSGSDEIEQLGQFDNEVVVVHPVERVVLEVFLVESGFEREAREFLHP